MALSHDMSLHCLIIHDSIPGKYAVERYPILKYAPSMFASWKREVLAQREKDIKMYTGLLNQVRDEMARGVAPQSFARHVIEEQEKLGMSDLEAAYTVGSPFGAGVETVS
jgi:hypothetical protein